jgi:urease accessory protein
MPNSSDAEASLYRLMSWLSPTYPVGTQTFSHGLEWCVEAGEVTDAVQAGDWIQGVLRYGSGRADAVLLTHAARANSAAAVREVAELALALCSSAERRLESTALGHAFYQATRNSWPCRRLELLEALGEDAIPYPVAVGVATAGHGIPNHVARMAYLHAFAASLIAAAVRLVPLADTEGQRLMAAMEPSVRAVAQTTGQLPLEGLGGCAILADIASMCHEMQHPRQFRS